MEELRARIAKACRVLGKLQLTKSASGHISARVPGTDTILIRARGPGESGVRFTAEDDVIEVGLDGKKRAGRDDLEPPHEVYIHTWLYRTRPDVSAVLHAHPPTVVLFTICNKPLMPIYGAYDPGSVRLLLEGIPTYPRSITVSNDELGQEFAATMRGCACLMRGHGITTCGATVEEATLTAIRLNELAEMNYRAQLLGDPQPISDEDIAHFRKGKNKGADRDGHAGPMWRYYCRLVGEEE
ncbi:MAG TPA: class II aldolase/adducin family protein [Beijerinckiaceae bacterium]|nr:class II aldolase/adducin family protein [Beijerinckiaceae bacterium]